MLAKFLAGILVLSVVTFIPGKDTHAEGSKDLLPVPEVGEDGMHVQDWFNDSFLNLSEDLEEAAGEGKRLLIVWEQRGCPYCKRMHEVNLRIPRVVDYIKRNFNVLQLNMWGDREVTDFDGEVLKEKELATKYGVLFTPTFQFFPENLEKVAGKTGRQAEVLRIPGYFKPFHFYFLFQYAYNKGYEEQPNFQRWLSAVAEELSEEGIKYDLWSDDLPAHLPEKYL